MLLLLCHACCYQAYEVVEEALSVAMMRPSKADVQRELATWKVQPMMMMMMMMMMMLKVLMLICEMMMMMILMLMLVCEGEMMMMAMWLALHC